MPDRCLLCTGDAAAACLLALLAGSWLPLAGSHLRYSSSVVSGRLVAILSPPPYDISRRFFQQRLLVCLSVALGERIAVKQTRNSRSTCANRRPKGVKVSNCN